jgi:glycine cleavage system protein P-like pyridoxal-binding family
LPETICFERTEAETLYSLDIYSAIKRKQKTKNKQTNKQTNKNKNNNIQNKRRLIKQ